MIQTFNEKIIELRIGIKDSTDYNTKFNLWADSAANICHDLATSKDESMKVDRFFYAFQSPPIESPKLLIIAFNPADHFETTYEVGCKNETRNFDRITGKELKEPNGAWNRHKTWRIWQNLMKSFVSTEMYGLLDSFVYMNLVYFGSHTVKSFYKKNSGAKVAQWICKELTNILVFEIFKPDLILCLGSECFNEIGSGLEQTQTYLNPTNKYIECKFVRQTNVIGIPHPSGRRDISDEEKGNIGEAIHHAFIKTPITEINRVSTIKVKLDKIALNNLISLVRMSEALSNLTIIEGKEKGGNVRFVVNGYDNDKLEITIASQGFIGIRHAKVDGKYGGEMVINNIWYEKILIDLGFSSDDKKAVWIGRKPFSQYYTNDITEIARNIEVDIATLLDRLL